MPFVPFWSDKTWLVQNVQQQTWPEPWALCVCTSNSWGLAAFSSGLEFTIPLPKRKKRGFGLVSPTARVCAWQWHPQCLDISRISSGQHRNGQWALQTPEELCRWGVSWPHTTRTLWNVHWNSECFRLLHAHETGVRTLHKGFGACSSPALMPEAVIPCWTVPCTGYCTKFSHGEFSHSKTPEVFALFGTGARFPKSSLEITSWNTPQALLLQAAIPFHILLKSTPHFWRSVCPDPVRAIPRLYLFKTAVTNHCSFLSISHWV